MPFFQTVVPRTPPQCWCNFCHHNDEFSKISKISYKPCECLLSEILPRPNFWATKLHYQLLSGHRSSCRLAPRQTGPASPVIASTARNSSVVSLYVLGTESYFWALLLKLVIHLKSGKGRKSCASKADELNRKYSSVFIWYHTFYFEMFFICVLNNFDLSSIWKCFLLISKWNRTVHYMYA